MTTKLDLCSGTAAPIRKADGYITTDIRAFDGVDYVIEIGNGKKLPFDDNSFHVIRAHDALEHIRDGFEQLMDECFRVLKPKGVFDILVPRFPMPSSTMHPDHYRFFIGMEDAKPFAEALAPLINGDVNRIFCLNTWAFFMTPADGVDPHGYLNGFWHLVSNVEDNSHIHTQLTPNKPNGTYPYKAVTRLHKGSS